MCVALLHHACLFVFSTSPHDIESRTSFQICCNANIDCGLQRKFTALICAAYEGHSECVRILADGGADKEAKADVHLFVSVLRVLDCLVTVYVTSIQQ